MKTNNESNKYCAKKIINQLEDKGLNCAEIAKLCNVPPSRIDGWKNKGQTPNPKNQRKLWSLMNLRLENNNSHIFDVATNIKLDINEKVLIEILIEQYKIIANKKSVPLEINTEIQSINSLESLNKSIKEQCSDFIYNKIDKDIRYKSEKNIKMSPYGYKYDLLPSRYNLIMDKISTNLELKIKKVTELLAEKNKQENQIKEKLNQELSFLKDRLFPHRCGTIQSDELESFKEAFLIQSKNIIKDLFYEETEYTKPISDLEKSMYKAAKLLEFSQFDHSFLTNRLIHNDLYFDEFNRGLEVPLDRAGKSISFNSIELIIKNAKNLLDNLNDFIHDQKERYSKLVEYEKNKLNIKNKIEIENIWNQDFCIDLSSGKILNVVDHRANNLNELAVSILKIKEIKIALADELHTINLKKELELKLLKLKPETIKTKVQIGGEEIYKDESFKISR